MADYLAAMEEFTAADLEKHSADYGVEALTVLQEANDVWFVPAGWTFSAVVVQGPLFYGVRKSWIFKSAEHRANYEVSQGLWALQGKNVAKMSIALDAMAD